MIKVDFKYAVSENIFSKYGDAVKKIHNKMENLELPGYEFLGWRNLPENFDRTEFNLIKQTVKRLKKDGVDTLVVIGIGGSFAGAKAAIEMINGEYNTPEMEIVFVGESISSTSLAQKLKYVENKNFAINVISKSGTTTEPAIAFRLFKKLLEEKVGKYNASNFIIATTDANKGTLLKIAQENDYTTFVIPDNIGGRFSVLTPVGLFPMACAGLDIDEIMEGALHAHRRYSTDILEENDAYKYALARHILSLRYPVELMVQYETQMKGFSEWWKQLAGESEGKNEKGLFPASAVFTTDLHSLGQFIQDGSKILFETTMIPSLPNHDVAIIEDESNADGLNYLTTKTVHEVNTIAHKATVDAHVKVGKVPNLQITFGRMDEINFGELVIFFERAVAMTAYLMGVNPFNQPGVEIYKLNMFKDLGKPE